MQKRPWFRVLEGARGESGPAREAVAAATSVLRDRGPIRGDPAGHGAGEPRRRTRRCVQSQAYATPGGARTQRLRGAGRERRRRIPTRRWIRTRRWTRTRWTPTRDAARPRRLRDAQRRQAGPGRHLRAQLPGADRDLPARVLVGSLVLQRQRQLRVLQPVLWRLVLLLGPALPAHLRVERLLPVGPVQRTGGATTARLLLGRRRLLRLARLRPRRPAGTTAATGTTITTEAAPAAGRPSTHGTPSAGGPSRDAALAERVAGRTDRRQRESSGFDSKAPGPGPGPSSASGRPRARGGAAGLAALGRSSGRAGHDRGGAGRAAVAARRATCPQGQVQARGGSPGRAPASRACRSAAAASGAGGGRGYAAPGATGSARGRGRGRRAAVTRARWRVVPADLRAVGMAYPSSGGGGSRGGAQQRQLVELPAERATPRQAASGGSGRASYVPSQSSFSGQPRAAAAASAAGSSSGSSGGQPAAAA
jgi:hypothetical protein